MSTIQIVRTNPPYVATTLAIASAVISGTNIVINGSGFGTKATAKAQYWGNFETSVNPDGVLGVNSTWSYVNSVSNVVSQTLGTRTGAFLRSDASDPTQDALGVAVYNLNIDKLFVSFKRYYGYNIVTNIGSLGFNNKAFRLWSDLGNAPYGNNTYFGWQGSEGTDSWRQYSEYTSDSTGNGAHGTQIARGTGKCVWQDSVWQNEQVIVSISGIGDSTTISEDGLMSWYRDGINSAIGTKLDATGQIFPADGVTERKYQMRFTSTNTTVNRPYTYQKLFLDQISNGTGAGPLYVYYDDMYIDTSWCRAFVSKFSNVTSAMKDAEMQLPYAWSDGQISATYRTGDLSPASPLYLYVSNNVGSINTTGYTLL